jgi:hypothetical protein
MTSEQGNETSPTRASGQVIKQRLKHEAQEWIVMFLYLWVIFGLFALYQSIILAQEHQDFRLHGFAILNALILSKVMLVAEGMHLGRGGQNSRPIVVILYKSLAFALLFILFHIVESIIVGVAAGKTIVASFPEVAGGHLQGIISLGVIVSVSLAPFFAFREVSRELGEGRLLRLLMERRGRID